MADNRELNDLLGRVFDFERTNPDANEDPIQYARRRFDFIFHMTDWIADVENLLSLFHDPSRYSTPDAYRLIYAFLTHPLPHLNAASRLLLDEIHDPFGTQS
jgi:hypothetical protein